MIIHNSEQVLHNLNVAYSLIDTVIAALDHPDHLANQLSLIHCLELGSMYIQQAKSEIHNNQSVVVVDTALLPSRSGRW